MCGIVGYIGNGDTKKIIVNGLKKLEYRGYDSAGIAYLENKKIFVHKAKGELQNLIKLLENKNINSNIAIGHTRWATHGVANEINAHPHCDMKGNFAVVHNGIIENYQDFLDLIKSNELKISSNTDTEIIPNLLSIELKNKIITKNNVLSAIKNVVKNFLGSYAIAILVKGINAIFVTKRYSSLVVGVGKNGSYLASDLIAIAENIDKYYVMKDGEVAILEPNNIALFGGDNCQENIEYEIPLITSQDADLKGYDNYMQKEIFECNKSIVNTVNNLKKINITPQFDIHKLGELDINIIACGTAYHAGCIGKFLFEKFFKNYINVSYASEFRYNCPLLNKESICIFISQSGETADTLACLKLAKEKGAKCIGITNTPTSQIARMVDINLPTVAGVELAVASTKAYIAQLSCIYYIVDKLSKLINKKSMIDVDYLLDISKLDVDYTNRLKEIVLYLKQTNSLYLFGRGIDYYLVMEGALKIKEISYIHCEALPAGELKHGSLALITKKDFVIVLLTQSNLVGKTINNIRELQSRGAKVILFTNQDIDISVFYIVKLPKVLDDYSPLIAMKPFQQLAMMLAIDRGYNVDKPRNLAKSVTVE